MEKQKKSFFSLRAHWALRMILLLVVAGIPLYIIFWTSNFLFREDFGSLMPTRAYAHQVAIKLLMDSFEKLQIPQELVQWRKTGTFDRELVFASSTLFWLTYDPSDKFCEIQSVNLPPDYSPELIEMWKRKLGTMIDSTFAGKSAGHIVENITDETGDFRFLGMLYRDEPRFVGMITDLDIFRKNEIPDVFENAWQTYPGLAGFAAGPDDIPDYSVMYVFARDEQDNIIAQMGLPDKDFSISELGKKSYKVEYPYRKIGFGLQVVIPNCPEKVFIRDITWAFYAFLVIWIITVLLWVRVEVLLKKARSN